MSATIAASVRGTPVETARAFEAVARELLAEAPEPCAVQFSTWPSEDGRIQLVCRVETSPPAAFGVELQWRWWSPLLGSPEELREALSAAVEARYRRVRVPSASVAGSAATRDF